MNFKQFCKMYSVSFCAAQTYGLLFPMFFKAYMSGTFECMLKINVYGEATIEVVFWLISFPFIMYGLYWILKDTLLET